MAFDATLPDGDKGINLSDEDIRDNFAAIQAALNRETDFTTPNWYGYSRAGNARAYYQDLDDGSGTFPTPDGSYDSGRLVINSDTNCKGQLYYHDGTNWLALSSTRAARAKDATYVEIASASGSWQDWDNASLEQAAFYMTDDSRWAYRVQFTGSFLLSAAASFEVRVYNVTNTEVMAYAKVIAIGAGAHNVHVALSNYYTVAASAAKNIKVQIRATGTTAVTRTQMEVAGAYTAHTLVIEEIPA